MSEKDFKIPKSLKDALKAGKVVPFVGAGVSMSVKKKNPDGTESEEILFPSWGNFIKLLIQALRDEHKNDEADFIQLGIKTKRMTYLDALQNLQESLGESLWYELFDEIFDKSKDEAFADSLKLNELIWKLSNNLIITTNVDRVFQWTCPQASEFKLLDVQNVEYARLRNEGVPKRPTTWYLHGNIDHKEKVIFTRDQFESFYKERDNEAKLQTLLNFLTQRTFVFIGFSLDDDYLRELLEYIHNIYKGGADSYFILFRERDIPNANFPKYVTPVPYDDFGKPLEDLVQELINFAKDKGNDGKDNFDDDYSKTAGDSKSEEKKPFFNVPYKSKGKEFVGRIGKREEIWSLLNQEGCAAIGQGINVQGLGGFGKTQLAVEYAHTYRDQYKNGVFWVVADENIDNQLLQIADRQGWINQYDKTVNQLDVAKAKFLALSDCLILFDNVETYDDIKAYLPKTDLQTHILITSREKQSPFRQIDLELLDRNESRELLLKIAGRDPQDKTEKEHLEKILEILGDIPLAVELVGGYLAEHENVTFAKYHQFLNDVPLDQLEKEFPEGSFTNHDRSIIQTLRISEETINKKPLMVEILKVLAWSGSSSMGTSLLKALVEPENEFKFETALGEAYKLRLLKKDEDAERYAIHRLLAKVIRHENPLDNQNEWHQKIIENLESWFDKRKKEFKYLAKFEAEIEHLNEWQNNTIKYLPKEAVWLIALESYPLWQRGNYQESLRLLEKSFSLYESERINNKELFANIQNDFGVIYAELGKYQEALKYVEKALELRIELFGEKHPDTARSYNVVGITYAELGKYQEALKYVEKALELRIELFGEKHPDTATSYSNMGAIYAELGKQQEALKYKEKALKLRIELFGEKHPDTATSYSSLGTTYKELGKRQEALKYEEKAIELQIELFGEKHPDTANFYNNFGLTYEELGKYQEALKYLEKALKIHEELLGKQHPKTIVIVGNLIGIFLKLGNKDKAGEKAVEFLGYVHPNSSIWKTLKEVSRYYHPKKKRHKKHRH
jgi:tetratricopeptide (TPR) repeat protein